MNKNVFKLRKFVIFDHTSETPAAIQHVSGLSNRVAGERKNKIIQTKALKKRSRLQEVL